MARIKYYYDTETCRYERVKTPITDVVMNTLGFVFICIIFGFGFAYVRYKFFPSDRERELMKENKDLLYSYQLIEKEIGDMRQMLGYLQHRDDKIYRVIFETDPIPPEIRAAGAGGSRKFQQLIDKKLSKEELVLSTVKKIDLLKRQMYIQTKSYDELIELAKNKTELLKSIPAIQPVANKELMRLASGFGMRMHPIYKVRRMHHGVDFSAPRGTPIYTTADGRVTKVEYSKGYGRQVEIDHGFGYITKYAHMSKWDIYKGQRVKRGQKIGEVGSTGLSSAPHLHYEVIHNKKKVNPINYFFNDLAPEQYAKLLQLATVENQSLGY